MKKLTIKECAQLESLLTRAIAKCQLELRVQSLGHDQLTGEDNVELFDGNGTTDCRHTALSMQSVGDEPIDPEDESKGFRDYKRQEVHLFITQDAVDMLSGNVVYPWEKLCHT